MLSYEDWLALPEIDGIEEVVLGEIRAILPNTWNHVLVAEGRAN